MIRYKAIITGGHLTPALAVIQEIVHKKYPFDIVFAGRKYALEHDTHVSEEFRVIRNLNLPFYNINTGRFRRYVSIGTVLSLLKIPIGIFQSLTCLIAERPNIIISFGGYIAFPIAFSGWILGIPIITHEQSLKPGIANGIIALFARRICVTWESTRKYFPKHKTICTGLPLRKEVVAKTQSKTIVIQEKLPIIYITGGVTGSLTINQLVFPIVRKLTGHFIIIHQTGSQWLQQASIFRRNLPMAFQCRYVPYSYLDSQDHSWAMHNAHIVISRAGANTVYEIALLKKVSILLPLSWSGREQLENAKFLCDAGSAIQLQENAITSETLYEAICMIHKQFITYNTNAQRLFVPNGTVDFLQEVLAIVGIRM